MDRIDALATEPPPAMFTALLLFVHLLSIVVWVGGMAFAHFCLRPALPLLAPPERLRLMHAVLTRFLNGVLAAALMTLASGLGIMFLAARAGAAMPWSWHAMAAIGLVSLPGRMTGVILGGASPATAIEYQIAIMISSFAGTAITLAVGLWLTAKTSFTPYGVLDRTIFRSNAKA